MKPRETIAHSFSQLCLTFGVPTPARASFFLLFPFTQEPAVGRCCLDLPARSTFGRPGVGAAAEGEAAALEVPCSFQGRGQRLVMFLLVDSPFFSTIVLFKKTALFPGIPEVF